jgi:hypothetical protein
MGASASWLVGLMALAGSGGASAADIATQPRHSPPHHASWHIPMQLTPMPTSVLFRGGLATATWTSLTTQPPFHPGAMFLLTDGTVMVQDQGPKNAGSGAWWRLTPDISGSYVNGTWSQLASLAAGYAPVYYASAVLPDGRLIIMGGEYNLGQEVWTNLGAIYDPLANSWTPVNHPMGTQWSRIGDGPSTVLANKTFMLGASGFSGTTAQALLNATSLTWRATGAGKADGNGEEGWSLLPDGKVLTVDTTDMSPSYNTELYNPATGTWSSAGVTPVPIVDFSSGEVGPQVLRPDGTVFAVGAIGYTAVFHSATSAWSAGPRLPVIGGKQYGSTDGAAAVLPDGKVLINSSPGVYKTPTHFFLFDGATLTQVADAPNANAQSSYDGFMLVLPTGQVLFNDRIGQMAMFSDGGSPNASWAPIVTSIPTTLTRGTSYSVSGKQLNGLTQASAYGDDYQDATNYPLVRIVINATGHVFYARTSHMSLMSVKPKALSKADFAIPSAMEAGAGVLEIIANGIASTPLAVTVQ